MPGSPLPCPPRLPPARTGHGPRAARIGRSWQGRGAVRREGLWDVPSRHRTTKKPVSSRDTSPGRPWASSDVGAVHAGAVGPRRQGGSACRPRLGRHGQPRLAGEGDAAGERKEVSRDGRSPVATSRRLVSLLRRPGPQAPPRPTRRAADARRLPGAAGPDGRQPAGLPVRRRPAGRGGAGAGGGGRAAQASGGSRGGAERPVLSAERAKGRWQRGLAGRAARGRGQRRPPSLFSSWRVARSAVSCRRSQTGRSRKGSCCPACRLCSTAHTGGGFRNQFRTAIRVTVQSSSCSSRSFHQGGSHPKETSWSMVSSSLP
jgi:hypothetical protein